jgi:hypothetical protein
MDAEGFRKAMLEPLMKEKRSFRAYHCRRCFAVLRTDPVPTTKPVLILTIGNRTRRMPGTEGNEIKCNREVRAARERGEHAYWDRASEPGKPKPIGKAALAKLEKQIMKMRMDPYRYRDLTVWAFDGANLTTEKDDRLEVELV